MSKKLFNFEEFVKNHIEYPEEISDIEDVLPSNETDDDPVDGRTYDPEDYYLVNNPTMPNHTIKDKDAK